MSPDAYCLLPLACFPMLPADQRRLLLAAMPRDRDELRAWVRAVFGFNVPATSIVRDHASPLDYLEHAFFEDVRPDQRDCAVWANRGGGKTQLGAVATLLDLICKPGIQVRILGGSFEQSSKMHRYLRAMLDDEVLAPLVEGRATGRAIQLVNGSRVEVLAQSERAVRGQRIHRLRCDEVELFDEDVWAAAQLVTRSGRCGVHVRASIESLSTMHRPFGLMSRLVRHAEGQHRRIIRWSALDVLERCGLERSCDGCPLWDECRGRARAAGGFLIIDDAIQQRRRVGIAAWRAEMLCDEPARADSVYPEFDPKVHVAEFQPPANLPANSWVGGIDFGFRAPTAFLWAFTDGSGVLHIVDEFVESGRTTEQSIAAVRARAWPLPAWIGADPAGHQRSDQTGVSTISLWRRAGFGMRTQAGRIEEGVSAVRARLCRADGAVRLRIHPRCRRLIEALTMYHYPPGQAESLSPVKDGHDHIADALRYLLVNLDAGGGVTVRQY